MGTYAKAKVTLTVEIDVGSTWGCDCQLSQLYKQAEDEARNIVKNNIGRVAVIIGTPTIEAIITSRK